jgi:hypothetical protein
MFYSGIEINMVRTNSSSDAQFEVLGLKSISIRFTINEPQTTIYLLNEITRQVTNRMINIFNKFIITEKPYPGWNGVVMSTSA